MELVEPGYAHDICSAIHPFSVVSPAYEALGLDIPWITPPVAVSHPLDGGRSAALFSDPAQTEESLGADGARWNKLIAPIARDLDEVMATFLGPRILPNPLVGGERALAIFGALPATVLARRFETEEARAMLAGLAAHSVAPLRTPFTSGVALLFAAIAQRSGWPLVAGGSERIADELIRVIESHGGEIVTGTLVTDISEFDESTVFLDTSLPAARDIARARMSPSAIISAGRFTPGPGVFKVDYTLDGPIPWTDSTSPLAGTVHVGGTLEEISAAEEEVARGEHPDKPFVLLAQQSDFDPSRAPNNKRTGWAYCHVPTGSDVDMTEAIESQVERFAPGFRQVVRIRHVRGPADFEDYNPNFIGGDIGGGRFTVRRFLPKLASPYRLGRRLYLCSAATPPGGGSHGMCGWHAAGQALR